MKVNISHGIIIAVIVFSPTSSSCIVARWQMPFISSLFLLQKFERVVCLLYVLLAGKWRGKEGGREREKERERERWEV